MNKSYSKDFFKLLFTLGHYEISFALNELPTMKFILNEEIKLINNSLHIDAKKRLIWNKIQITLDRRIQVSMFFIHRIDF